MHCGVLTGMEFWVRASVFRLLVEGIHFGYRLYISFADRLAEHLSRATTSVVPHLRIYGLMSRLILSYESISTTLGCDSSTPPDVKVDHLDRSRSDNITSVSTKRQQP